MVSTQIRTLLVFSALAAGSGMVSAAAAQPAPKCAEQPPPGGPGQGALRYEPTQRLADGRYVYRLCAPRAQNVRVVSTDMPIDVSGAPSPGAGLTMAKDADGYWAATTARPVAAGLYRYTYKVDGLSVADPQSENFAAGWRGMEAILTVPGPEAAFYSYDPKVPHGVVALVDYPSSSLGELRRAHVYTPPGYEAGGAQRYPVLYLVHGTGGRDSSWTDTAHANWILDNLIASKKAVPMIVVMPFGHTPPKPGQVQGYNPDFGDDLLKDLIPHIDKRFRTLAAADKRAMAGLSMGGSHTLNFGLPHPEVFAQVGVFSMGLQPPTQADYLKRSDAGLKARAKAAKPVFYAMGKEDFLYPTVAPTRKMFDQYGIKYDYHETGGGHDWPNWRDYLALFAPTLFK